MAVQHADGFDRVVTDTIRGEIVADDELMTDAGLNKLESTGAPEGATC
ncbi:hypothetical protein [Mesorhizobium sp. M7D.F.Ca.US.005.01.1.1]|jgi:hypothetical protein|nr:hypothetical protein [Mesorhizobium sp. M7D.F.Ca.US.005.01.1.1]